MLCGSTASGTGCSGSTKAKSSHLYVPTCSAFYGFWHAATSGHLRWISRRLQYSDCLSALACPAQAPERVERTPSPDTREDAGASSGESNTQKVSVHEGSPRHEVKISEPADPSGLAPSRGSGRGEPAEKVTSGKDGKHGKLPRPEGTTPCPRCDSTDTKFCYYNNYNVKQPRYFCKVGRYSPCSSPRVCTLPTVAP